MVNGTTTVLKVPPPLPKQAASLNRARQ